MKINILFQNIEFANADQSKKEILKNFLEDLRNKDKKNRETKLGNRDNEE